jgi:tetratricopeptide (TPR) repeat protein
VKAELRRIEQVEGRVAQAAQVGDFARALRLSRKVLEARQRLQGPRHWQAINAHQVVGWVEHVASLPAASQKRVGAAIRIEAVGERLRNRQQLDEAEKRLREALAAFQEELGEQNPRTATSLTYLACCLLARGRHADALPLYRKALAIQRRLLGEEHPNTAASYSNVATCLNHQGKHDDALRLFKKVLAISRKVLGSEHPSTATSYNNVAACLNAQGKHAQALPLFEKALAIKRKVLGEEHPDTAHSYSNVAACLDAQGRHIDALRLSEKALAICRKVLGEEHPDTAQSYNNLASCLDSQSKHGEALPLYQKALLIWRKVLGEEHPHTATSYHNLASCLDSQGKRADALPHYRKALQIRRKVLGEEHPHTADSYNGVAFCLNHQGKQALALPLFEKALAIRQKVLGEEHPDTAISYNNVANCLDAQDRHTDALPLHEKALAIFRKVLGEDHTHTATSYNNVAFCLNAQGRHADALPLYEKALAIRRKVLGSEHPGTAAGYNNLACCLNAQGRHADALPLFKKALAISRKVLGEEHAETAGGCNNLAGCLKTQGRHADALPLYRKALAICRKVLGEHPRTANSYNNLAGCLSELGRHDAALPLHQKALALSSKLLGEHHSDTATNSTGMAFCLNALGKHTDAIRYLRHALLGLDAGRLGAAAAGFDRSLFASTKAQPRELLACLLAREGKHDEAWEQAEAHLARGLLDALAPTTPADPADSQRQAELAQLNARLLPLLIAEKPTAEEQEQKDSLLRQRSRLESALARSAAGRLNALLWSRQQVQKHLAADTALVLWLDAGTEHWGCVLRRDGPPRWERLPASGTAAWTRDDWTLPARVYSALQTEGSDTQRQRLLEQLRKQRLAPLNKHLGPEGKLPAVRRLVVVPVGLMAEVPVEVLAPNLIVSYTPSATLFARRAADSRPVQAGPLVALGDPVYEQPRHSPAPAPSHGLLLRLVVPGGNAWRAGLRAGDVLLEYAGVTLKQPADLPPTSAGDHVAARFWREGETSSVRLQPGPLGITFDNRAVAVALAAWREGDTLLLRGSASKLERLPGTRLEVRAIAEMVGQRRCTLLLGSSASEQELDRVNAGGLLRQARIIHLATHGKVDRGRPDRSCLELAQDRLPDPVRQVRLGRKVYDGQLKVATVVREWNLDCDLVVLSACESGLGKPGGGEGLVGFAAAFLHKGARSVVLSRWRVDDNATTLLMQRFYENLLGKRKGLKKPTPRALALAEARKWLAALPRTEAEKRLGRLAGGVPRGTFKPLPTVEGQRDEPGDRPFAPPRYWAAFVILGDPD